MPSFLPINSCAVSPKNEALAKKPTNNVAVSENGISIKYVLFVIGKGAIIAAAPRISNILAILLPNTFPMAISELPLILEMILIFNSGMDVPNDTIVRPITMLDNPYRVPNEVAPSTNTSAPLIKNTKPRIKRIAIIGIVIVMSSANIVNFSVFGN